MEVSYTHGKTGNFWTWDLIPPAQKPRAGHQDAGLPTVVPLAGLGVLVIRLTLPSVSSLTPGPTPGPGFLCGPILR